MAQSDAQSTLEKWRRQSQEYSVDANDALITLICKVFETSAVVLSPTSDNVRIDHAFISLDNERKLALQFEKEGFDILRHLSFGLIEAIQVLLKEKGKNIEDQNQTRTEQVPNASLAIVEPKEEPSDSNDQILNGNQVPLFDNYLGESLFKEEEIDFDFGDNNSTLPMEQSLNELASSYMEESGQPEMNGEENDSMEDEDKKDTTVLYTIDTSKDMSGEVKKMIRPMRTLSRPVRYTVSFDETEPLVMKLTRTTSEKKNNKRKSDIDESSSNASTKGLRVAKINDTELECPNCEYRSRSVQGWYLHLTRIHSTNPHKLGLALLCECGNESFSEFHSLKCEISKITVIRKTPTPQCVMCEAFPTTAKGYAAHLDRYHNTSLKQMGMFLICSCGVKVTSNAVDPEHTKKCNGHSFASQIG